MRKAVNIGIASGIIISIIFIAGSLIRKWIPAATFANRGVYLAFVAGTVALVFWMAMNYYSKSGNVKWGSLNLTGLIASFIAAIIFSTAGFLYTRFIDPRYLTDLMDHSQKNWLSHNALAGYVGKGELRFFRSPSTFAWNNFQDMLLALIVLALVTATVFYLFNKNREPLGMKDNHELIF